MPVMLTCHLEAAGPATCGRFRKQCAASPMQDWIINKHPAFRLHAALCCDVGLHVARRGSVGHLSSSTLLLFEVGDRHKYV